MADCHPPHPPAYEPPPPYTEFDAAGNVISDTGESPRRKSHCSRLPLSVGCQVFGWLNILLHSSVLMFCIYGYFALQENVPNLPAQVFIFIVSVWVMASFAIFANVMLLIGVYKKSPHCIKIFIIIYGIYISLVVCGLFKQSIAGHVDSKQFCQTLIGITLAVISVSFGHIYYIKLKKESLNQENKAFTCMHNESA